MRALFLLLACASPLVAEADSLGFKGVELGSSLARIASDPRHECHAVNTPIGDTICGLRPNEKETIAGAPVVSLFYFYDVDHLSGIQITISEKAFQPVVAALTAKYGASVLSVEKVQNLKGGAFENRTYLWKRPDSSLQALRYSGSLDKSLIRYSDEGALRRLRLRRANKDPNMDL